MGASPPVPRSCYLGVRPVGRWCAVIVDRAAAFEDLRPRLRGLAYRMLGSVGDAEDVVQDAFLRWHQVAGGADNVRSPEAWLVTVVTRLGLDRAADLSLAFLLLLERLSPEE